MANLKEVRPGKVFVDLGEKRRELKFDLNAFAELETKFGTVEKAMQQMQSGSMKSIRTIVWVGLIHEEAVLDETGEPIKYNISEHQVGSWLTPSNLEAISGKLALAIGGSLPTQTKEIIAKEDKKLAITNGYEIATVEGEEEKNG